MNEVTTVTTNTLGFLSPSSFDEALKIAEFLMKSDFVPDRYKMTDDGKKNNTARANVLVAMNMAQRMNKDLIMIMQSLYTVHGTPSWSSKYLIANFNASGRFSALEYVMSGTPGQDDFGCRVWALEHATSRKLTGPLITIAMAKAEGWYARNPKWKNISEQMLRYRGAAWFINTIAPELSMGLMTQEEAEDIRDVTPQSEKLENAKYSGSRIRVQGLKENDKPIEAKAELVEKKESANPETGEVKRSINEYGKVIIEPVKEKQKDASELFSDIDQLKIMEAKQEEINTSWELEDGQ